VFYLFEVHFNDDALTTVYIHTSDGSMIRGLEL